MSKRFEQIVDRHRAQINALTLEQLEDLGEVLLEFTSIEECDRWLASRSN